LLVTQPDQQPEGLIAWNMAEDGALEEQVPEPEFFQSPDILAALAHLPDSQWLHAPDEIKDVFKSMFGAWGEDHGELHLVKVNGPKTSNVMMVLWDHSLVLSEGLLAGGIELLRALGRF